MVLNAKKNTHTSESMYLLYVNRAVQIKGSTLFYHSNKSHEFYSFKQYRRLNELIFKALATIATTSRIKNTQMKRVFEVEKSRQLLFHLLNF